VKVICTKFLIILHTQHGEETRLVYTFSDVTYKLKCYLPYCCTQDTYI